MVRKIDRWLVKDVKVILGEECVPQHRIVSGKLVIPMKPQNKILSSLSQIPECES